MAEIRFKEEKLGSQFPPIWANGTGSINKFYWGKEKINSVINLGGILAI